MSNKYNIIEYIPVGFRPFGLKYVFIYYLNYLRKFLKMFISPTSGIRAHKTHTDMILERPNKGVCQWC